MEWTEEQKKVIELRDRNILVSAAAGSGKTAVLVERILSMVTDEKHPVDIDRLLIVTFTKAAAGEMKERIRDAIDRRLEEDSENEYLQRQLALLHNAQITTIDSFCQYVLKSYFHVIDLDPGYRVGEEGELKLLKRDVAEEIVEEAYAAGEESFHHCVECFAPGKSDRELEDLIMKLYEFSMSYPWPEKWLAGCAEVYEAESLEQLNGEAWMKGLTENVRVLLTDALGQTEEAIRIALQEDGPYMYEDALLSDRKLLEDMLGAESYLEFAGKFAGFGKLARLSGKKDVNVSEEKREQVKNIREQVKKTVTGIAEQYFYDPPQRILSDLKYSAPAIKKLLELAEQFLERFAAKKREKNLVDFGDMEHFALNILVEEKEGQIVQREAAKELAGRYEEILIDEYQDSNLVQELILTSVSKKYQGKNNIFMVGDVKQSIYRFRLARPELFMEKFDTYTLTDSPCQRIDLHKNFRSRSQVLAAVNFLFYQIMDKSLGNVDYNKEAALYAGARFPERSQEKGAAGEQYGEGGQPDAEAGQMAGPSGLVPSECGQSPADDRGTPAGHGSDCDVRMLLLDLGAEPEVVEEAGETERELEARMIGREIQRMVGREEVLDKQTQTYRKARYSDMVILLRTVTGWGDTFAQILGSMGIPAFTGSRTGYFSAVEIQTVLALLKIIDNPCQDIPMAAVLSSPIGNLSAKELAMIKSSYPNKPFHEACRLYALEWEERREAGKLRHFFELLEDFRKKVPYTPMHGLLWYVLEKTGYGRFASAMPGGAQRQANINMLVEKAIAYEAGSYRGLFNFIRYIETLKKYDVDYGEASFEGEAEDTVRIVSIHKSKGLEYPIVFAAGMGKRFNQQDTKSKLVLHPELGAGCDYIDPALRLRVPTLLKKVIQRQTQNENLGEELRVLYVALTRAKEKLILTASADKLEEKLKKWKQQAIVPSRRLSFTTLSGASCYLDWIMPAILRHRSGTELLHRYGLDGVDTGLGMSTAGETDTVGVGAELSVRIVLPGEIVMEEAARQLEGMYTKEELLNWDPEEICDREAKEQISSRLEAVYPYERNAQIHTAVTVSELKKRSQAPDEPDQPSSRRIFEEPVVVPLIPRFMQEEVEVSGAARGTVYHKVLENLDFNGGEAAEQIAALKESGRLSLEEAEILDIRKIARFLSSPLGRRMAQAQERGQLYREQQFILGVDSAQVDPEWEAGEEILVQGIIDAFFYEKDGIVLVDYKTDFVQPGKEASLYEKYRIQLDYYALALERLKREKVKEKILYSFWLQKELRNN